MKNIIAKFLGRQIRSCDRIQPIAAGISLAIIAAVGLGSTLNTKFSLLNTSLK